MTCLFCGQHAPRPIRLPEGLPASELIQLGAPLGQVHHALSFLGWAVLPAYIQRHPLVRRVLHDKDGIVHELGHYLDQGPQLDKAGRRAILDCVRLEAQDLEELLEARRR